jgi:hypothetical protein
MEIDYYNNRKAYIGYKIDVGFFYDFCIIFYVFEMLLLGLHTYEIQAVIDKNLQFIFSVDLLICKVHFIQRNQLSLYFPK